MKRLALSLALTLVAPAAYAEALAKTGSVKHSAYVVCRSVAAIDLGEVGSDTSADCTGIVKTVDGSKPLDNLALHCLEGSVARKAGYKFTGSCVETDGDGDKLFLTYEGPEDGPVAVLGGAGKFKGIKGQGRWRVTDAPGNTASLFAFTLDYDFDWTLP
jgi:hypothetical protein